MGVKHERASCVSAFQRSHPLGLATPNFSTQPLESGLAMGKLCKELCLAGAALGLFRRPADIGEAAELYEQSLWASSGIRRKTHSRWIPAAWLLGRDGSVGSDLWGSARTPALRAGDGAHEAQHRDREQLGRGQGCVPDSQPAVRVTA